MIFHRERERVNAVSLAQIEEQQKQRLYEARVDEINLSLDAIKGTFATCPVIPASISEFRIYNLQLAKYDRHRIRSARFNDGFTVLGTTRAKTEDRAHQLVVTNDDEVIYERTPVNVRGHAPVSQAVHLEGVSQIVDDPIAVRALAFLSGAALAESGYEWRNTYGPGELAVVRSGIAVPA